MTFQELINLRQSVRKYSDKPVERGKIEKIIAAAHFCLQAAELGLGTCMIGWFDEKKLKLLLNIPEKRKIGLVITLGYPPEDYKMRKKIRKPLAEICGFNSY